MEIITSIRHRYGEYPVIRFSDHDALATAVRNLDGSNTLLVTDQHVALHQSRLVDTAKANGMAAIILPAGDDAKSLANLERIWQSLAEAGIRRDGVVLAFGGGMIGDLAGFAAATWMRGIRCIQVPTTLIAQVDSSIGGKTAINTHAGKNLVGAFHQPDAVWFCHEFLDTLPDREYRSGFAEVVKTGLLCSETMLAEIERHAEHLLQHHPDFLPAIVTDCIRYKASIVMADETENGQRALLNLGHTFAHAIEKTLGYGTLLHGEAVAIGLVCCLRLSESVASLPTPVTERMIRLLETVKLPTSLPAGISIDTLVDAMMLDKKARSDAIRFILLQQPGEAFVAADVPLDSVRTVLRNLA